MKSTKPILLLAVIALLLTCPLAQAGDLALSRFESGALDLVFSLDWQPTDLDKARLAVAMEAAGETVFASSQGLHHLRNVYLYAPDPATGKPRMWGHADCQFANTADDGAATVNGFLYGGDGIWIDDNLFDPVEAGQTVGHEVGHYVYGQYDEYAAGYSWFGDPSFPWPGDTPKETLMANHRAFKRFSVTQDYNAESLRSTAQYRMYNEASWTILAQEPNLDALWTRWPGYYKAMPARKSFADMRALARPTLVSQLLQPTNNPPVNLLWMEGREVVLVLEHSAAMDGDLMAAAASGANSFVRRLGADDYAALVAYNASVTAPFAMAQATDQAKAALQGQIDGLAASGARAPGDALRRALEILESSPRENTMKCVVWLTTGSADVGEAPDGQVLDDLAAAGYPVYALGLGDAALKEVLAAVSEKTRGGWYLNQGSARLNASFADVLDRTGDTKPVALREWSLAGGLNQETLPARVGPTAKKAVFQAAFPPGTSLDLTLLRPDGRKITPLNSDGLGAQYFSRPGYAVYLVDLPPSGVWDLALEGDFAGGADDRAMIQAWTDSAYTMYLGTRGGTYPQPLVFWADVFGDFGITGLNVTAQVTAPDGNSFSVPIADDGRSPDQYADDGVYTAGLDEYLDGGYRIQVTASDTFGLAKKTGKGKLHKNWDSVMAKSGKPLAAGVPFELTGRRRVEAKGAGADQHGGDFGGATPLTMAHDPVEGRINGPDDRDAFSFEAEKGRAYTLFTGLLFPVGARTFLELYDQDRSTRLMSNTTANNGASKIVWKAPETGRYYLSVSSADQTTPSYVVGVRPAQSPDYQSSPSVTQASAVGDGGDSSGGGCFVRLLGH